MLPVVSIVGRPNVGKSTLFNRLIGQRKAIVHDSSGVTRDRHYGDVFWNGRDFKIVDTGGYIPDDPDLMVAGIRDQVDYAIEESDVILFLVDVESGVTALDKSVTALLRRLKKPVILVANKADNAQKALHASEFYELGFDEVMVVSSMSGTGTGDLLDRVVENLPEEKKEEEPLPDTPRIAIIGRPNVGKSSLINSLLKDERSIVSEIAGTTRDSINSILNFGGRDYLLVDTAGLRRRTRVKESIEFYSTLRSFKAIRECDVALLLIDAIQGFEAQDIKVLREAEKFNKGIILIINKWDLVESDHKLFKEYVDAIYARIPSMKYIPILSISALTGKRVNKIIDLIDHVIEERKKKIPTAVFNKFLGEIIKERPLPYKRGHQLKINYGTQVKANPPVFIFFMNQPKDLPANYRKYIESKIRERFIFEGVPVTLTFKQKS
ncbi:MAG TPA: ribosome biogenesis GTPase Der [Balneolales bacterium]|nr:ribosome biogenesis GTPase Der [Balneolales bacterium]